jgi:hypothetical protein
MLVYGVNAPKLAMAEVTLVCITVLSLLSGPGISVPFQKVVCDQAISVTITQGAENRAAVDALCVRA